MEPQALIDKQWQALLDDYPARQGTVSLAINPERHPEAENGPQSPFRVRLLTIDADGDWLVERPYVRDGGKALGSAVHVIGTVAQGETRLQFDSRVIEQTFFQLNPEQRVPALRLSQPRRIRSAQRRAYFRVRTVGAELPPVRIAPILELKSVIPAERACFQALRRPAGSEASAVALRDHADEPRIGRMLNVKMLDVSGNGLAIQTRAALKDLFTRCPYFWLAVALPHLPEPIRLTATVARIDQKPADTLRIGLAFHFQHHPAYRRFVTDQFCHFAAEQQRLQLQRQR